MQHMGPVPTFYNAALQIYPPAEKCDIKSFAFSQPTVFIDICRGDTAVPLNEKSHFSSSV